MPKISVPGDMGGDLIIFPEGAYNFVLKDIILGTSQAGKPKLTFRWICQSESENADDIDDYTSTIGETLLDSYSLQPQALFGLNNIYKQMTQEQLPQGDYEMSEFVELVKDALNGASARIIVEPDGAGERNNIVKVTIT